MDEKLRETLQKQLELLSERSKDEGIFNNELADLTHAMVDVALAITYPALALEEQKASRRLTTKL